MKLFTLAKSEKLVFKLGQACSVCVVYRTETKIYCVISLPLLNISDDLLGKNNKVRPAGRVK